MPSATYFSGPFLREVAGKEVCVRVALRDGYEFLIQSVQSTHKEYVVFRAMGYLADGDNRFALVEEPTDAGPGRRFETIVVAYDAISRVVVSNTIVDGKNLMA